MTFLALFEKEEFDLEGLARTAGKTLARGAPSPSDGRVSDQPDERTIRYYQSLGILSKPLRYDGRKAIYGYSHLLQLLAVKLLQASGLSLAQIQSNLLTASRGELEALVWQGFGQERKTAARRTVPPQQPDLFGGQAVTEAARPYGPAAPMPAPAERPEALIAREVAPGVTVVIDPSLVASPERLLQRIQRALSGAPRDQE